MTEQFEFLSVVISCESLLRTLHVENMEEELGVRVVAICVEGSTVN